MPEQGVEEEFRHAGSGAGRFTAAVELRGDTAGEGLLFIIQQQDFMNDGGSEFQGELHQGLGNGGADQVRVVCAAAQDDSQSHHGIRTFFRRAGENGFNGHRNFKGSRYADDFQADRGKHGFQFFRAVFYQGLGVLFVVFRGDDADFGARARGALAAGKFRGHEGMEWKVTGCGPACIF